MANYKVIQDIEAEDKLLGPLSLRQFVYAAIAIGSALIGFRLASKVKWFLGIPFIFPMGFFGILAAPLGHDQSSEIWLLARIRFLLKPRARIWDQNGMKHLVTITVPKKVEARLTNGLTPGEVTSRLHALASTLDSRGWAVKNTNLNLTDQSSFVDPNDSDRLITPTNLPQDVPSYDIGAADDILDASNNPTAQHLDQMINAATMDHKQQLVERLQNPKAEETSPSQKHPWFMDSSSTKSITKSVTEKAKHAKDKVKVSVKNKAAKPKASKPKTEAVDPVILELANRNDFNVATLSRQAEKSHDQSPDDEVVIPLR